MARQKDSSADERAIRKVIDDRAQALRAKDAAGVVAHGTKDIVQFSLAPPLQAHGSGLEGLAAWFASWEGPIGYEVTSLSITAGEDVAFAHSLNRMSGTKTDGEKPDVWFRETLGFRKLNGRWMIVHGHESVPFYMDGSLKAAVDLKP